jgi:hypothetical protein
MFVVILLLWCIAGHSQTLTQNQDPYVKVKYLGYDGSNYIFRLYNLQGCSKDNIAIQYANGFIPGAINPNTNGILTQVDFPVHSFKGDSLNLYVTGTYTEGLTFGFQSLTVCNWEGTSPIWVYVQASPALPVKFISFTIKGNYQ